MAEANTSSGGVGREHRPDRLWLDTACGVAFTAWGWNADYKPLLLGGAVLLGACLQDACSRWVRRMENTNV
jgi:hypothetical protein